MTRLFRTFRGSARWGQTPHFLAAVAVILGLASPDAALAQGQLDGVRQDVRVADPPAAPTASPPPAPERRETPSSNGNWSDSLDPEAQGTLFFGACFLGACAVTSPIWAPIGALQDDYNTPRQFAEYPYSDITNGYMTKYPDENTQPWTVHASTDYGTAFDDLDAVNTRLLFTTSRRLGIDAQISTFGERLPHERFDSLWLGDCNAVFTFAQNDKMQWRTGVGVNWLNDHDQTDLGFNFTYGFDLFPRKPWVISAELDWGNLGHSGLFHFRSTVGAAWKKVEAYTGYEYYDFDRVQSNFLIGGVRVFF